MQECQHPIEHEKSFPLMSNMTGYDNKIKMVDDQKCGQLWCPAP